MNKLEQIFAIVLKWMVYEKILPKHRPIRETEYGISQEDGSNARKLIAYYLGKRKALPVSDDLRRELGAAVKETGIPREDVIEILEPIHRKIMAEAFRASGEESQG